MWEHLSIWFYMLRRPVCAWLWVKVYDGSLKHQRGGFWRRNHSWLKQDCGLIWLSIEIGKAMKKNPRAVPAKIASTLAISMVFRSIGSGYVPMEVEIQILLRYAFRMADAYQRILGRVSR